MLSRREFLASGTAAAALAAAPSDALAQSPRTHQTLPDAVPPTSPNPVSTRPSDNLGGSTIKVGHNPGDLQRAINASAQGDTLVVPAGVAYSPITLPIRTGNGWTCIRTASDSLPAAGTRVSASNANAMFKVHSGGERGSARAVMIPAGTQGWRFIGMEATHPNDNFQYGLIDGNGSRTSFERCYIHGRPTQVLRRCIFVIGNDFQLWDSWLSEAKEPGSDSQAIFFRNNARAHVENCELQGAGENIMLGDQGSDTASTDVTLKRNHFFKPLTWRKLLSTGRANPSWDGVLWVIKELFEIKWAKRVLLEGNVLENNWGLQGQEGVASLFTSGIPEEAFWQSKRLDTSDVMVRSNIYKNTPYVFAVGKNRVDAPSVERTAYLNNLALDVGGRFIFLNHAASDVWIEHNTCAPQAAHNSDLWAGLNAQGAMMIDVLGPGAMPRMTLKRNLFGWGSLPGASNGGIWFLVNGGGVGALTNAILDTYMRDRSWAENARYDRDPSAPLLNGMTYYASAAAAGIDTKTGRLNAGSPLIRAGSDGKDIGVDFVTLDSAQTGT